MILFGSIWFHFQTRLIYGVIYWISTTFIEILHELIRFDLKNGELLLVIITWSHSLSTSWVDWLPCVLEQLRPSCLPLASQSVRESSVVAWSARDQWRCWTKPIHNHHPRILIPRFLFKWFYKMKKNTIKNIWMNE